MMTARQRQAMTFELLKAEQFRSQQLRFPVGPQPLMGARRKSRYFRSDNILLGLIPQSITQPTGGGLLLATFPNGSISPFTVSRSNGPATFRTRLFLPANPGRHR